VDLLKDSVKERGKFKQKPSKHPLISPIYLQVLPTQTLIFGALDGLSLLILYGHNALE